MSKPNLSFLFIPILIILPMLIIAQDEEDNELVGYEAVLISGHLGGSFPAGNLRNKLSVNGFGGGGQILVLVDRKNPLYLGVDVSHFNYDQEFFY